MAAQSFPRPSSSSASQPIWNYDVFLSFRGKDTRKNFTDHLYTALVQAGINTFRDDDELPRGKEISFELVKAIEESRISIVVFSKGYASSNWCLDELVKIVECKNSKGQTVLPIFYDVDPSDVRHQISTFAEAFGRHEKRFNLERMQKWRAALTVAANLSGYDLQNVANGHQAKLIQKVVEDVLIEVNCTDLNVAIHPIGIDSRVEVVEALLDVGASDVRIVGIYGMGGIGKTTIAKAVYNKIHYGFDGSSCLLNIKEISEKPNGLVDLQEQLLYDILKRKISNIGNSDKGITIIKRRLQHKRVLIVLDDVDHLKQLNSLVENCSWFGSGSRVIITTRDESLLIEVGVYRKYKVEKLNHDESLQLINWHAFKNTHPIEDYLELLNGVVNYVQGLPLALKVLGSSLYNKSKEDWKSALEKLQKIPNHEIQKILRISFDSLDDDTVKDIFLDIACFFIGMKKEYAIKILDARGFFPNVGLSILIQRSLVTIIDNEDNELGMHDLLRDMGREIVREKAPNDPGKRSRLWFYEDVLNVLKKQTGSKAVEGLVLNLPIFENVRLKTEAFAKMKSLRLLQINDVYLSGCFEHFPQELRWLCWHKCLLKFLPSNFHLEDLVILDMQYSNVKQVWKGIKVLNKLKVLNLSNSECLTATPNFSRAPRLERLILEGCTNLVEVQHSIGNLKELVFLNLEGCKNLKKLPNNICNLESLQTLNLSGCSKLYMLPEQFGNMRALRELHANETAFEQLPYTFGLLKNLETMSLSRYKGQASKSWLSILASWISLRSPKPISLLPASFSRLSSLTELSLNRCNLSEEAFPIDFGSLSSLKGLSLEGNNFRNLPHCISHLPNLSALLLNDCTSLQSISDLPESLVWLDASKCTSLERSNNFMKSLLQALSKGKLDDVLCPGNEIPNWFTHQRIGSKKRSVSSTSFHVPSLSKAQIIQELVIWVVFAAKVSYNEILKSSVIMKNKTKGHQEELLFDAPLTRQDHSWIKHMPLRFYPFKVESGDELELSIRIPLNKVIKCGIHLVVDPPNVMDNHGSLIQYTSPSSHANSDTATEGKMGTLCAKRDCDNNKAGPSYEEKCPELKIKDGLLSFVLWPGFALLLILILFIIGVGLTLFPYTTFLETLYLG